MICCWTSRGELVPHLVGPVRAVEQEGRARRRRLQHVDLIQQPEWWQATKPACRSDRWTGSGRGPKRRCDTVIEPDFFES